MEIAAQQTTETEQNIFKKSFSEVMKDGLRVTMSDNELDLLVPIAFADNFSDIKNAKKLFREAVKTNDSFVKNVDRLEGVDALYDFSKSVATHVSKRTIDASCTQRSLMQNVVRFKKFGI